MAKNGGSSANQMPCAKLVSMERLVPVIAALSGNSGVERRRMVCRVKSVSTEVATMAAICHGLRLKPQNRMPNARKVSCKPSTAQRGSWRDGILGNGMMIGDGGWGGLRQPEKGWGWFGEGRILYYGVGAGKEWGRFSVCLWEWMKRQPENDISRFQAAFFHTALSAAAAC